MADSSSTDLVAAAAAGGGGSRTDPSSESHKQLLAEFVHTLHYLLKTLSEDVFPDSDGCAVVLAGFEATKDDAQLMEETMREWYAALRPHLRHIAQRNEAELVAALGDLVILRPLGVRELWRDPDFDQESREIVWEYIDKLTKLAAMACVVPHTVMARLQRITVALYPEGDNPRQGGGGGGIDPLDMMRRMTMNVSQEEIAGLVEDIRSTDMTGLMEITSLGMSGISQSQLDLLTAMAGAPMQ